MKADERQALRVQLTLLLEGRLDPDQRRRLEDRMRRDPEVLAYSQEYFILWAGLYHQPSVLSEATWVAGCGGTAARIGWSRRRWMGAAAVAACLLVVLGWWALARRTGRATLTPPVAWVEQQRDAQWSGPCPIDPNGALRAGAWTLRQGVAQLRLRSARLLLQGPCELSLDGPSQVTLRCGKLTARMLGGPGGFDVVTPAGRIRDLGTEFGVLTQRSGETEVHVFDGHVEVTVGREAGPASRLDEGQAARVDPSGHYALSGPARPDRFLRRMPAVGCPACAGVRLDLADIVGGGNGLGTGQLDQGLDPCGGQVVRPNSTRVRDVHCTYTRLPFRDYIDGVLVANRAAGLPVVTSAGHVFKECPLTDSDYYEGIFNGAKLSVAGSLDFHQGVFDGQAYGTREYPALNLHANAGITFDLDAIRADYPGTEIDRFTATAGISDTVLPHLQDDDMTDVWVLLDGKVVYYHRFTARGDHHAPVAIEIDRSDRFLTLVATSDDDSSFSWSFLAEPMLELSTDR